jgi:carbon starvation protein CstA
VNILKALLKEAIGMFVDDGSLAIAILIIVAIAAWVAFQFEHGSLETAAILFVGCLAALAENVIRTVRKSAQPPSR